MTGCRRGPRRGGCQESNSWKNAPQVEEAQDVHVTKTYEPRSTFLVRQKDMDHIKCPQHGPTIQNY